MPLATGVKRPLPRLPSGGGAPTAPMNTAFGTPQYGLKKPVVPSGNEPGSDLPQHGPLPDRGRGPKLPWERGGGGKGNGGGSKDDKGGKGGGGGKGGVPGIGKYLKSDEQYQNDRAALIRNFRNLQSQNVENRQNVNLDYGTTKTRLGEEQAESLRDMQADFAARGLFGGAGYLDEEQEFNKGYLNQFSDAATSRDRNVSQLLRELANARTLKQENLAQARLEAIRRRAAQYGIKE